MRRLLPLLAATALLAGCGGPTAENAAAPAAPAENAVTPTPVASAEPEKLDTIRVRLVTSEGDITVALDAKRAPKTVANFMAYVDDGRLEGTKFYRASRTRGAPGRGFIQGGIGSDPRRKLDPVELEPTSETGLRHLDGTLSMAHADESPDSANCNFSILVGPAPSFDAHGANKGYAAFGKVIAGMDVVKRILGAPTSGGRGAMKGQMLTQPVEILRAERLDGTAKPTGLPKVWQIVPRR